jgi:hypothetical protein
MARLVLAIGVVILLAIGAWLAFAADPVTALSSASAPTPEATAGDATPAAEATAEAPAALANPDPARSDAPALADAELPPIPADARWAEVLVLDKATKQPVEGAEATWWDETAYQQVAKLPEAERGAFYTDSDRLAQRWARRGRSDRDGKLRVHIGKQWTVVQARHGGRYGATSLQADGMPPKDGHRVLLELDCTLRVHVVDAIGQPAVDVALSLENHDPDRDQAMYVGGELRTDANGMATFAHVQNRRTVQWGAKAGQQITQWRLFVAIPGLEMPPILIDAVQVPSEPVEVQLPPTGRLRAKATMGGQPLAGLQMAYHLGPKDDAMASNRAAHAPIDPDGWVRFRHVALGKTLFVMARQSAASVIREVPGPTLPGQEVELAFDLAGESIVITGRLLGEDGEPVASQTVGGTYDATRSSGGVVIQTDAAGRFVWWIAGDGARRDATLRLNQLAFEWRSPAAIALRVEVPPRDLVVGTNDLGTLRFGTAELIVGGRFSFDTPGTARTWFYVKQAAAPPRPSDPEQWEHVHGLMVDVQEDGRFEVRGKLAPGRQRIEVQGTHHLPVAPVEFTIGTRDLVIPVQRGVPLKASCLLPDGISAHLVALRLQPQAAAPGDAKPRETMWRHDDPLLAQSQAEVDGATPYAWAALPAGAYTLRVETSGLPEPFLEIPDVVLPLPEGGDPRLQDIDLRERMTALRVRFEWMGTQPPRHKAPVMFLLPQADEQEWLGLPLSDRETVLPMPTRALDLLVACEDFQPVTLRGVLGSATVTMSPWPTVPVTFQGLEALPAGAFLHVSARPPDAGQRDERRYRTMWRRSGLSDLLSLSSGTIEVRDGVVSLPVGDGVHNLAVYLTIGEGRRVKSLQQLTPNELVGGAPVTVQLSADEIRRVVAELQQQEAKANEGK